MSGMPAYFIFGSGSGTGKTTFASRLQQDLESRGLPTACLYEIEIRAAREFAAFQKLFAEGDPLMKDALCSAIDAYLTRAWDAEQWFISESLFPFLRWLILGNCPRETIEAYCAWLNARLGDVDATLVCLGCSRDVAIARAQADRGEAWLRDWSRRQRHYPLYQANPDLDLWDVFERELTYVALLDWPCVQFDTATISLEDMVSGVLGDLDLPARLPTETLGLPSETYRAEQAPHPLLETLEVRRDQIRMMGVWLDLVPRRDGGIRIANSNSTIDIDPYGAVLHSTRFGRVRFNLIR